jgi:hypothetical protein
VSGVDAVKDAGCVMRGAGREMPNECADGKLLLSREHNRAEGYSNQRRGD